MKTNEGYRGYAVRKEYGVGPGKERRFNCKTIEEEAANTIQYFWRKWKGKTLYQQLLLYRADKTQKLNYFCQQVNTLKICHANLNTVNSQSRSGLLLQRQSLLLIRNCEAFSKTFEVYVSG